MKKALLSSLLFLFVTHTAQASDLIVKTGALSVDNTIAKIQKIIDNKKGVGVFTVVDHKKNAQGIGMVMQEAQVIIFGNPKMGTKIMQKDPLAAIDLPLKVLVYRENNNTKIVYRDPQKWRTNFKLDTCILIDKMSAALHKITTKASEK